LAWLTGLTLLTWLARLAWLRLLRLAIDPRTFFKEIEYSTDLGGI
jgi:hypothetical protein